MDRCNVTATSSGLQTLLSFTETWLSKTEISPEKQYDILIIVEELTVNIVNYAYDEIPGKITPVSYTHLDVYKRQIIKVASFTLEDCLGSVSTGMVSTKVRLTALPGSSAVPLPDPGMTVKFMDEWSNRLYLSLIHILLKIFLRFIKTHFILTALALYRIISNYSNKCNFWHSF